MIKRLYNHPEEKVCLYTNPRISQSPCMAEEQRNSNPDKKKHLRADHHFERCKPRTESSVYMKYQRDFLFAMKHPELLPPRNIIGIRRKRKDLFGTRKYWKENEQLWQEFGISSLEDMIFDPFSKPPTRAKKSVAKFCKAHAILAWLAAIPIHMQVLKQLVHNFLNRTFYAPLKRIFFKDTTNKRGGK